MQKLSVSKTGSNTKASFFTGVIEMLPLCISIIPWGILAGSMSVQAGLSFWQGIGMSAIIFAGAAQLVTLGLAMSGANMFTIIISVFFLTSQHFIYGLTLREFVSHLRLKIRLPIGFLLTDELFALSEAKDKKTELSPAYMLGAGLIFYIVWNVFSLIGIIMASSIPDLEKYHLDFSIIATFITLIVPMIKKLSTLSGVILSLLLSMLLSYYKVDAAIIIAGISGMFFSTWMSRLLREKE